MSGGAMNKAEASSSSAASDVKSPSTCDHQRNVVVINDKQVKSVPEVSNETDEKKGKEIVLYSRNEGEIGVQEDVQGVAERKQIQVHQEAFYEVEAIRKKRINHEGQLQYLIKWVDFPEKDNTWDPYNNIKYCTDMLEDYEKSLQKSKGKKAVSKEPLTYINEDGGDKLMLQKGREENSPSAPVSGKGKEKNRGSVPALTIGRDINVLIKRNPKRKNVRSRYMRDNDMMNGDEGKDICPADKAPTNAISAPSPDVQQTQGVFEMDKKGGAANFVMQDYVRKWREAEEAKGGVGATAIAIFLPNCDADIAENGKDPSALLPMGAIPFESEPHGSKELSRLTGAQKRKSGRVRRFVHPDELVKNAMNTEIVDLTEDLAASHVAVNTGIARHITKILKPVGVLASSSPTRGIKQPACINYKALRSDGTEVLVNNKELRATNPLLLLDFYEQYLHYTGP